MYVILMTSDLCWCSSIWSDETISWSLRFSSWSASILPSASSSWCFVEKSELQAPISSRSWFGMRIFLSLSHVVDCTRVCPVNQLILFPLGLAWSGAHMTGRQLGCAVKNILEATPAKSDLLSSLWFFKNSTSMRTTLEFFSNYPFFSFRSNIIFLSHFWGKKSLDFA